MDSPAPASRSIGPEPRAGAYACPRLRVPLEVEMDRLVGPGGTPSYPIRAGVRNFRTRLVGESEPQLRRLNEVSREQGWSRGLETVYGADRAMMRYVSDPRRAAFIDILPLTPRSVVLEIGPGLGQFSSRIASRVAMLHALELSPGQAEFVALRCEQEGSRNVEVSCGGDDCLLPYVDGLFDVVVCNLVFEWCVSPDPSEGLLEYQERLLREFYRVLRPRGTLYLATKNRFGLPYLTGQPDEHLAGMRFGSALPHPLQRWALKRRGIARPEGVLHSYSDLRRLLMRSGFDRPASYWAAPDMRYPDRYVRDTTDGVLAARAIAGFPQGNTGRSRLLMPLIPAGLVRHVAPGLVFLATRPASSLRHAPH